MYHRVLKEPPRRLYDPGLFVTASTFEMHIKEISQLFEIVSLEKILQYGNGRGRLCAITFDDGWIDSYEVAFPILKQFCVPATVFVPVGIIGSNYSLWFENLWNLAELAVALGKNSLFIEYFHNLIPTWIPRSIDTEGLVTLVSAMKSFPANKIDELINRACARMDLSLPPKKNVMDWEQVSEMGEYGVTFGSHGLRHYILPTIDNGLKRKEIFESLEGLKNRGARTVPFFSFPNGEWDRESLQLLHDAKYRGALTTRIGFNVPGTNPFLLNRIGLHEYISNIPELLWFRIFQAIISGSGPGKESDKR